MTGTEHDYADEEVKGLERLLPTKFAKVLAVALLSVPLTAFQVTRANPDWFLSQAGTWLEKTLVATVVCLVFACVIALLLVAEMAHVLSSRKHRRIVHYTAEHPSLSVQFLWRNTRALQKLVVLLLALFFVSLGYFAAGA